jgi:hypothetical protein
MTDTAQLRGLLAKMTPGEWGAEMHTTITHAAILAAVERLPENLDGSAAIADALCNALGVEVPEKRAPWEVAYEAWRLPGRSDAVHERVWQAAVEWCVEQIDTHKRISGDDDDKMVCDAMRRRIMGQEQQL